MVEGAMILGGLLVVILVSWFLISKAPNEPKEQEGREFDNERR